MAADKRFYVNTGKDGILADTSEDDVRALVEALAEADRVALHFHGGLVDKQAGLGKIDDLKDTYLAAGVHPVFFVWEAGLLEILRHNLDEINREKIFRFLLGKVVQRAVGKLRGGGGKAAGAIQAPNDVSVAIELEKAEAGVEPYAEVEAPPDLDDLTDAERERFERDLTADPGFEAEVAAIVASAAPDEVEVKNAKGIAVRQQQSVRTLMSPQVIEDLRADAPAAQAKGLPLAAGARMAVLAGKILFRVIRRFRKGRAHGVYVTAVEEILRELYIANVGAEVWHLMKQETADAFDEAGREPKRGGWFFVEELGRMLAKKDAAGEPRPEVSLVGHSTGAVYICHLLAHVDAARRDPQHPLPRDFTFDQVVFMAPACSFELFSRSLERHSHLIGGFRMFAMSDEKEKDDVLVPVVYPRSLLYFVSGVVEREADGKGAFDLPLVGMERYFVDQKVYAMPEVERVRKYVAEDAGRRAVWSVADGGAGLSSNAVSHGAFDDLVDAAGAPLTTMTSVAHLLSQPG